MADNFGLKIGIEGEKEFKNALRDINQSFKVLGSEMTLVESEAVELCVYLCKLYGLTEKDIICHSEGYKLGTASNHGDVMHWFPKHGKSMDTFRADVKAGLAATEAPAPVTPTALKKYYRVQVGAYSVKANADAMLAKIKAAGFMDAFIKYSE